MTNIMTSEEALDGEEEGNMDADDASSAALASGLVSGQYYSCLYII